MSAERLITRALLEELNDNFDTLPLEMPNNAEVEDKSDGFVRATILWTSELHTVMTGSGNSGGITKRGFLVLQVHVKRNEGLVQLGNVKDELRTIFNEQTIDTEDSDVVECAVPYTETLRAGGDDPGLFQENLVVPFWHHA